VRATVAAVVLAVAEAAEGGECAVTVDAEGRVRLAARAATPAATPDALTRLAPPGAASGVTFTRPDPTQFALAFPPARDPSTA
jgi:hypothetical protein